MGSVFFVFAQLLSLLLEALSCPDQGVQLSTLSCLEPVLIDPPPALIQQLEALVSRLLALVGSPAMVSETRENICHDLFDLSSKHKFVSFQNVRIASLRCIHALSRFPVHEVRLQFIHILDVVDLKFKVWAAPYVNVIYNMHRELHESEPKPLCHRFRSCRLGPECCELWRSLWTTRRGWWGARPFRHEESGKKLTPLSTSGRITFHCFVSVYLLMWGFMQLYWNYIELCF